MSTPSVQGRYQRRFTRVWLGTLLPIQEAFQLIDSCAHVSNEVSNCMQVIKHVVSFDVIPSAL